MTAPVIGRDVHAALCVDDQGKVECVCGLEALEEQAAEAADAR